MYLPPVIFPLITTTISFFFFVSVTEQYLRKRKPHQLVWAVSMFLFFITAGAEGASLVFEGWEPLVYRGYYLLAAIQVSLMGGGLIYLFTNRGVINENNSHKAGMIFFSVWSLFSYLFSVRDSIFYAMLIPSLILLVLSIIYTIDNYVNPNGRYAIKWRNFFKGDRFAHLFLVIVIYIFLLMNLLVWTEPLNHTLLQSGTEISGCGWETQINSIEGCKHGPSRATVRFFSPLHTIPGAIALIGGGIYSYITWQRAIKRQVGKFSPMTGIYNLYIAFGAWVLGLGATLSGFGLGTLYISEVISVTFMYYGFLESDKLSKNKIISALTLSWLWNKETSNLGKSL